MRQVRGPLVGLAVIAGAVIASWALQARQYRAVQADDWAAAAAHVRDHFEDGDVVRIAPFWADDARVFLPGLPVDVPHAPDIDTLTRYDRVWLIAGDPRPGRPHVASALDAMPAPFEVEDTQSFGDVTVRRYRVPSPLKPAYVFTDSLHRAQVQRVYPTQPTRPPEACDLWREQDTAWHCNQRVDPYLYIGLRYREMDGEPRRCVFAAPAPEGGWTELTYTDVPMRKRLRGRFGLSDESTRSDRGSDVLFEVLVNGTPRHTARANRHEVRYMPFAVDTSDLQGQTATVTFRVHAADLLDRFPCFEALVPADASP